MEGVEVAGVAAGRPGKTQQVVSGAREPYGQPSTTLSYQTEFKKPSSFLIPKKSFKRKKSERFSSADVEYFLSDSKRWTDKARLSTNSAKSKLYLDFGLGKVSRLDRSLSLSSVSSLSGVSAGFKLKRSSSLVGSGLARIKLGLNSSLEIEHAVNLSWNFQVVLKNELGRHKIAFYSEGEAKTFVRLAINKGATLIISNAVLSESPLPNSPPTTSKKSRTFEGKRPLRPISENLQYFEDSFPEETEGDDDDVLEDVTTSNTMPTQINNNASKILRRKSTGSSDTSKSTSFLRKKSPMTSTVSVSSVDHKFQRQNSMTGRSKKGVTVNGTSVWYDKNLIDTTSTKNGDEYYDDDATITTTFADRMKAKKKSHNSLESEEMTSDDGCVTSPEDSDVSESDEEAMHQSLASHGSYEDLVDGLSRQASDAISRRPMFGSAPSLSWRRKKRHDAQDPTKMNSTTTTTPTTPPVMRRVQRVRTNEKLEKFKFMLVNIEQDPEIIDPGFFGADDEFTFHRFDFNDYPSEVFYPTNDFYDTAAERNAKYVDNGKDDDAETDKTAFPKTGNGENWIRKSCEQLTMENVTPATANRSKLPPRSKSLESETRTVNVDSESDCGASVAECDSFYDVKSTLFCDCDGVKTNDDSAVFEG